MELLQVNQTVCTRCGFCAGVCPDGLIDFKPKTFPKQGANFEALCINCGACMAACQSGALTHKGVSLEVYPKIQSFLQISPSQCEQMLRSRRSIRAYKDQSVKRGVIQQLINIARYAPTGHNRQEVEWTVIDNKEEILQIEKAAVDWIKIGIKQNPQMSEMLKLPILLEKQEKSYKQILRGAPVVLTVHTEKNNGMAAIDCVIALTYLELTAKSIGLGTCWAGLGLLMANTFPPVQKILALPEGHSAYGMMMLGYPAYNYARLPSRKDPKITWHD